MSRDGRIILIILIINLIVAIVYLILHLRKKDRKKGITNFVTFLVFPIVGFTYMGISELVNLILYRKNRKEVRYEDLSFDKTRMKLAQDPDVDKSMDTVPLEEALIMSGKEERRQSLMEVLKKDSYTSMIGNIKDAVGSDDNEVSHYAATFITDTIARYKARELELRKQAEKNPSPENLSGYIRFLQDIVDSGLFEGPEQERFLMLLDGAARNLYETDEDSFPELTAAILLKQLQAVGNEEKAEYWLTVIKERSGTSLVCFKTYAEYCFAKEDRKAFFAHLESVKSSSVVLDNEALEWIRFFA